MQATMPPPKSRLASRESGGVGAAMVGVEDFIKKQWPSLKARVADLENKKRLLEDELQQIEKELGTARQEFAAIDSAARTLQTNLTLGFDLVSPANTTFEKEYKFGDVSIKQAIRLALDHFAEGLSSRDLYMAINRRYFESKLKRESFSPQLSRLMQDREVEQADKGWVLTPVGKKTMRWHTVLPYRNEPDTNEPPSA
ncbi:hypothetical protein HNR00_005137 [Methylorubrum rhodinum]|uniref:Uncharacterized protein n=1 Tax=Methylorubrum rhodinum TaxID=29428 RepID=A0A840ZU80_9HYPH|nr:hypothetical protein [Methylorubrum rhodinum]MBB5760387.1 hypothetical protein [Methylorubrum rhodinum]